ncbi:MAG: lipid-A-disaccharide synthase N-terminal domain-containing protein [Candidatus Krumholzibacteria bacterium]|jgi:lipid-A-disaccharide synthase-like uncharacterized protein|nr:lipid-A-disaccharide synthase N-terminal domain-containing protein [Candidatus Krumholzibacteria bacterium]MDY0109590.1 lipid-A-disaccharide synthase N-terminal domain-containing protein [Candidatus Krumholzibacteria bacterium]
MSLDAFAAMPMAEKIWLAVGILGQLCFAARFIVQWLASEARHRSTVPIAFWYLSLIGGLVLLSYAIWRRDPVFILGQAMGGIVYVRNLMLIQQRRRQLDRRRRREKPPQT